jgi:hypothetical protein
MKSNYWKVAIYSTDRVEEDKKKVAGILQQAKE